MAETAVATPQATIGMTKLEAVRQTLQKLGNNATRNDLQSYLKKTYGFDMSLDHISNYKNKLKSKPKKSATPKAAAPKPAAAVSAMSTAAVKKAVPIAMTPKMPAKQTTAGIDLNDIETAKELIGRIGQGQFRGLIDLLSK